MTFVNANIGWHNAAEGFFGAATLLVASVVFLATIGGLTVLTSLLFPNMARATSGAVRSRKLLSFLVGFLVCLVFTILLHVVHKAPPAVAALGAIGVVLSVAGLTGVAHAIGERVHASAEHPKSQTATMVAGWLVLGLACAVPFFGWFVVYPIALFFGTGSLIVGYFTAGKPQAQQHGEEQ